MKNKKLFWLTAAAGCAVAVFAGTQLVNAENAPDRPNLGDPRS